MPGLRHTGSGLLLLVYLAMLPAACGVVQQASPAGRNSSRPTVVTAAGDEIRTFPGHR